jgi:trk system potassium uptake protein TrkA
MGTAKLDVVIVGGGRVGIEATRRLDDYGHDVTVIERNDDRVDQIADEYLATVIQGDATDPDAIEQAGIGDADVIAGLTGNTGVNLSACLVAREYNESIRTVARIDKASQESYQRFVDSVVFPERAGGRVATSEIIGSPVETLADVTGKLDIMEIRVAEGAPGAGKKLSDVRLPAGSLIISDDDGERIARPETTLTAGKRYVVAVEQSVADEVVNLLRG